MNAVACMLNLRKLKIVNMERHERIAKAISVSGLKKGEVASACGVANSAITQWITGESKSLKPENLYALAKATGFNAMWIAIGEGPERPDEGSTSGKKSANLYTYPVLSWTQIESWSTTKEFPTDLVGRFEVSNYESQGNAFWTEVKGDSMKSPTGLSISEGTMILVDPDADPADEDLIIALLPGSAGPTFRQLIEDSGQQFLKPLNPNYPLMKLDEDCKIVGVIVQAMIDVRNKKRR